MADKTPDWYSTTAEVEMFLYQGKEIVAYGDNGEETTLKLEDGVFVVAERLGEGGYQYKTEHDNIGKAWDAMKENTRGADWWLRN